MQKLINKVISISTSSSRTQVSYQYKSTNNTAITSKRYSSYQNGMSASEIVFLLLALGVFVKLAIAIIPAQVGDYQFTNIVASELKEANESGDSATEFMENLSKQLTINASYDTVPSEMIRFTNTNSGRLAVEKNYEVVNNFFGNVDIVNRFEGEIEPADAND